MLAWRTATRLAKWSSRTHQQGGRKGEREREKERKREGESEGAAEGKRGHTISDVHPLGQVCLSAGAKPPAEAGRRIGVRLRGVGLLDVVLIFDLSIKM